VRQAAARVTVSRFAPAPTGYLHLGHVLNAIYVWGVTRAAGGRVLLRIEDHDRQRSRTEFENAILEDLAWLGFVADGPARRSAPTDDTDGPAHRPAPTGERDGSAPTAVEADLRVHLVRQSDRGSIYDKALARLRDAGLVYACQCSRAAIGEAQTVHGTAAEQRYPGTCAEKHLAEGPGLGVRVRLPDTIEHFGDLRHGPQTQRPSEQCGDLLVKDRDGNWTYQFAATVDDHVQGVTLVIRGDDLLASTGRQQLLARMLGRQVPPRFLHHALLMKSPTQKISKSDGDTGVRDLRARGWTAADVIGEAACRGGLTPEPRPLEAVEVSSIMAP
jgi:glutamyl-tRNA synthetase/glutamyl-Q tRNA(Asp) synthetase